MITSCQNCTFAIYDQTNKTQTGCYFDRIEKFKKAGHEVIEAYNEQGEFYLIGQKCNYNRDKKPENWEEFVLKTVKEERIDITSITATEDIKLLQLIVEDINEWTNRPQLLITNRYKELIYDSEPNPEFDPKSFIDYLHKNCKAKWTFVPGTNDYLTLAKVCKTSFFMNYIEYEEELNKLNYLFNEKLKRFALIYGPSGQEVIHTNSYIFINGSNGEPFNKKLEGDEEGKKLILTWKEVEEICSQP